MAKTLDPTSLSDDELKTRIAHGKQRQRSKEDSRFESGRGVVDTVNDFYNKRSLPVRWGVIVLVGVGMLSAPLLPVVLTAVAATTGISALQGVGAVLMRMKDGGDARAGRALARLQAETIERAERAENEVAKAAAERKAAAEVRADELSKMRDALEERALRAKLAELESPEADKSTSAESPDGGEKTVDFSLGGETSPKAGDVTVDLRSGPSASPEVPAYRDASAPLTPDARVNRHLEHLARAISGDSLTPYDYNRALDAVGDKRSGVFTSILQAFPSGDHEAIAAAMRQNIIDQTPQGKVLTAAVMTRNTDLTRPEVYASTVAGVAAVSSATDRPVAFEKLAGSIGREPAQQFTEAVADFAASDAGVADSRFARGAEAPHSRGLFRTFTSRGI